MSSLLTCRLVNNHWNESVVPCIRSKNAVHLPIGSKDFSKFCEDFEATEEFPFSQLEINLDRMSLENCTLFFNKHGSAIQNLKITEALNRNRVPVPRPDGTVILEKIKKLQHILSCVKNLKTLYLKLDFISESVPRQQLIFSENELQNVTLSQVESLVLWSNYPLSQQFLNELFALLPNVRVISLGDLSQGQNWVEFVEAMQALNIRTIHRQTVAGTK